MGWRPIPRVLGHLGGISRPLFRGHDDLSLLGLYFLRQRLAVARTRITKILEKGNDFNIETDEQENDIFRQEIL